MHFHLTALTLVAFALALPGAAAAAPLRIGIADNDVALDPAMHAHVPAGVTMHRIFLTWKPRMRALDERQHTMVENATASGRRVYVTVLGEYGVRGSAPGSRSKRRQYVAFLKNLVRSHPQVRHVGVWNEPNYRSFWPVGKGRVRRYMKLLIASYDTLAPLGVRVGGPELGGSNPVGFTRTLARNYRRTLRWRHRPLFHIATIHAYPRPTSAAPWSRAPWRDARSLIGQSNVPRWRAEFRRAFRGTPQRPARRPIWITETGYTTGGPALFGGYSEERQAEYMAAAVHLARCQKQVRAIFFFQQQDDPQPGGWQTGIIDEYGARKPAYVALERAASERVPCHLWPRWTR